MSGACLFWAFRSNCHVQLLLATLAAARLCETQCEVNMDPVLLLEDRLKIKPRKVKLAGHEHAALTRR